MYAKDLNEPEKRENVGIKHLNYSKAFIEYAQCIDDVSNNIDDCNPPKKKDKF